MKTTVLYNEIHRIIHCQSVALTKLVTLTIVYQKEGILSEKDTIKEFEQLNSQIKMLNDFSAKMADLSALILIHNEKPSCHSYQEIEDHFNRLTALLIERI